MQPTSDPIAITERYRATGYAALPGYISPLLCGSLTAQFVADMAKGNAKARPKDSKLVAGTPLELHSNGYAALRTLHWGMTPGISALTACELLPTFGYLRMYRRGDVLRIHADRFACEHSLSLVLMLKDDIAWPLEIATADTPPGYSEIGEDFGSDRYESLPMGVGDGLLYPGMLRRHGRMTPNPNSGSMHLFLHWVDPDGPFAEQAFDRGSASV